MEERFSRGKFIRLGAALGAGAAGASALTACGGGGGSAESGGQTTGSATSASKGPATEGVDGAEVTQGGSIAQEADVAPNSAVPFTDSKSGEPAVLVRLEGGDFVAYSAVCTHQRCTVAYRQDTQKLACPCHGSVFDPASGAKVEVGPARTPLPGIPVEVQGGDIILT